MGFIILYISVYIIFSIGTFIVYAFLKEMGFWSYIYEEAYTHPKFDTIITIIGDVFYGIGISIIASVGFAYYSSTIFAFKAMVYGIIMIIMGSTIKEYFKG